MWTCYLGDTTTGLLDCPIDIPSFTWTVTVSDSSLSTVKNRGVGEEDATGLTIPWSAIPGSTPEQLASAISSLRRCLVLFWDDQDDRNSPGIPVVFGAIGQRTDTQQDTSFDLLSVYSLLQNRYAVEEGTYGKGIGGTTQSTVRYQNMSYRGIASNLGILCTNAKQGGSLPIDWTYENEPGTRAREYKGFDIQNNACSNLLDNLTNIIGGPDMQFRPYMADPSHVRVQFVAGSDSEQRLGQSVIHRLTYFPGGGTFQNLQVDRDGAYSRVYSSGSGTDEAQLCYLAEDLSLVTQRDPYPLMETTYSDSDTDNLDVLKSHAESRLDANCVPIMQISGDINFNDPGTPKPGTIWPGEMVDLDVQGFPTLPDGIYRMRLMYMSGDASATAKLKFDVYEDPLR